MNSQFVGDSFRGRQTNSSHDSSETDSSGEIESSNFPSNDAVHSKANDNKSPHKLQEYKEITSAKMAMLKDSNKTRHGPASSCDSTRLSPEARSPEHLKRTYDFNKILSPTEQDQTHTLQHQYYTSNSEPPMKMQIVPSIHSQADSKFASLNEAVNAEKDTFPLQQGNCYERAEHKKHTGNSELIYPVSDTSSQELSIVASDSSEAFVRHKTIEESNLSIETPRKKASSSPSSNEKNRQQTYHELTPVSYAGTQYNTNPFTSTPLRDSEQPCQNNSESYPGYLESETPDKPKNLSAIASCMDPAFYYHQKRESDLCSIPETAAESLHAETLANQQIYYVTSTEKSDRFYTRDGQIESKDAGSG